MTSSSGLVGTDLWYRGAHGLDLLCWWCNEDRLVTYPSIKVVFRYVLSASLALFFTGCREMFLFYIYNFSSDCFAFERSDF